MSPVVPVQELSNVLASASFAQQLLLKEDLVRSDLGHREVVRRNVAYVVEVTSAHPQLVLVPFESSVCDVPGVESIERQCRHCVRKIKSLRDPKPEISVLPRCQCLVE